MNAGNFSSAKRHVLTSFANTESAMTKKRAARFMVRTEVPVCRGKRLKVEALAVTFAGMDIADLSRVPMQQLKIVFHPWAEGRGTAWDATHPRAPGESDERDGTPFETGTSSGG